MKNFTSDIIKLNKIIHPDISFSYKSKIILNILINNIFKKLIKKLGEKTILADLEHIFCSELYNHFIKNYNKWIDNIIFDINKVKHFCKKRDFDTNEIKLITCIMEYIFAEILETTGLYILNVNKNIYKSDLILMTISKDKEIDDFFKKLDINYYLKL